MENINLVIEKIVNWMREIVKGAGAEGLVFGLSGGIDSAVVAGLSKLAFPETSLGVIMPCYSDPIDEEHGILVARALDLEFKKVDLSKTFDVLISSILRN